ncbi:hypothetical protein R3P38DRAFT_3381132 [Favolaschia claudopus]|uniref:Uncharacterized protein n=1 Tax=Favolaschia claudopus TaxID=2862362 RepID=A0AAV9YZL0_9AGAR
MRKVYGKHGPASRRGGMSERSRRRVLWSDTWSHGKMMVLVKPRKYRAEPSSQFLKLIRPMSMVNLKSKHPMKRGRIQPTYSIEIEETFLHESRTVVGRTWWERTRFQSAHDGENLAGNAVLATYSWETCFDVKPLPTTVMTTRTVKTRPPAIRRSKVCFLLLVNAPPALTAPTSRDRARSSPAFRPLRPMSARHVSAGDYAPRPHPLHLYLPYDCAVLSQFPAVRPARLTRPNICPHRPNSLAPQQIHSRPQSVRHPASHYPRFIKCAYAVNHPPPRSSPNLTSPSPPCTTHSLYRRRLPQLRYLNTATRILLAESNFHSIAKLNAYLSSIQLQPVLKHGATTNPFLRHDSFELGNLYALGFNEVYGTHTVS